MARSDGISQLPSILSLIGRGKRLRRDADETFHDLFGIDVRLEGLSKLFQPSYPGVRTFVIQARATPDRSVEFTLVGIDRGGRPIWVAERAVATGIEGALEIHRGVDQLAPEALGRGIHVHSVMRELELIRLLDGSEGARITADGDYRAALDGFHFADETPEGPPAAARLNLDPVGDRQRLIEAALHWLQKRDRGLDSLALEALSTRIHLIQSPWDLAQLKAPIKDPPRMPDEEIELGAGNLGRRILTSSKAPIWQGAMYAQPRHLELRGVGEAFRSIRMRSAQARSSREIQTSLSELHDPSRSLKLRALSRLALIGPTWVAPEVQKLIDSTDRKVADAARRCLKSIAGNDLPTRMLAFANNTKIAPNRRAIVFRVLAEHYPKKLEDRLPMLRVDPDARIQRTAIPLVAAQSNEPAQALASMLAANPVRPPDGRRPGDEALRLELIEEIALLANPSTLLPLSIAYRAEPPPSPSELLALSRALVAIPDPRAQLVLRDVAARFSPPSLP